MNVRACGSVLVSDKLIQLITLTLTMMFQVILAGTLTGVQGDIRCKVLAVLSTVK